MPSPSVRPPVQGLADDLDEGEIRTPQLAAAMLEMPLSRALTPADLRPIALPVLCRRVLSSARRTGTLELFAGNATLTLAVDAGSALVDPQEHSALMAMFDCERARFRFRRERQQAARREPVPFGRLALDGVRRMLRRLDASELEVGLGARMALAPAINQERVHVTRRMGFSTRERRFIDTQIDGVSDVEALCVFGGLGKVTVLQLLAQLELFDLVTWSKVESKRGAHDPALELDAEAVRVERADYFDVLGLHWSASESEIQPAYVKRRDRYAPGSLCERQNPSACARIRARLEEAYQNLRTEKQRTAYRKREFKGHDFSAIADLEEKRAAALSMRGDARAAALAEEVAKEVARSVDSSRSSELAGRAAHRSHADLKIEDE